MKAAMPLAQTSRSMVVCTWANGVVIATRLACKTRFGGFFYAELISIAGDWISSIGCCPVLIMQTYISTARIALHAFNC